MGLSMCDEKERGRSRYLDDTLVRYSTFKPSRARARVNLTLARYKGHIQTRVLEDSWKTRPWTRTDKPLFFSLCGRSRRSAKMHSFFMVYLGFYSFALFAIGPCTFAGMAHQWQATTDQRPTDRDCVQRVTFLLKSLNLCPSTETVHKTVLRARCGPCRALAVVPP